MELLTVFGWLGVQKYFSGKPLAAGIKKFSICGNCFFILTLLGVCHATVAMFCPLITTAVHCNSNKHCLFMIPQQTRTRDFTCSISEFTSSTGSLHVNSPDSVNKFGVFTCLP